jgi:signal transduction histidine kinase
VISSIEPRSAQILVVDDRDSTRYSTVRVLTAAGARVTEAANAADALRLAPGQALVVLDVNLPDMDGFEVCRILREDEATADIPVVHLSASYRNESSKILGLKSGADAYLTHPAEPEMLIATINALLRARRAEAANRQFGDLLRTVFRASGVGIAIVGADGRIAEANPAFCTLVGAPHATVVGASISSVMSAEPGAAPVLDSAPGNGIVRCGLDTVCECTVSEVGNGQSVVVISDISARLAFEKERERLLAGERAARTEAERANAMKDDFLAVLSHELRNPLNNVLGWSHILKRNSSDEMRSEAIEAIERNVLIQVRLVEDLLDVSRIAAGKLVLEKRRGDLHELVRETVHSMLQTASQHGVAMTLEAERSVPMVFDPARMAQICINLISNAIKFTPAGGAVKVSLRVEGEEAVLVVEDNGVGIGAEFLPHIFDRFRQGDASTTRRAGGLGLGLAIVNSLVGLHGGSVRAASEGVDRGARFEVRLPRIDEPGRESASRGIAPVDVDKPLLDMRIYIVDDSPEASRVLSFALQDWGAVVNGFGKARDALNALAVAQPSLIISDISMPEMDGYEFLRAVRAAGHDAGQLPALALTAFARDEDIARAREAGFQGHVAKPVDIDALLQTVLKTIAEAR